MKRQRLSSFQNLHHLNFEATELRLGLPQTSCRTEQQPAEERSSHSQISAKQSKSETRSGGRTDSNSILTSTNPSSDNHADHCHEHTKTQVVGWPPVRSYRKNVIIETEEKKKKKEIVNMELGLMSGMYVKVSLDGAPYLRKIDLKLYQGYQQLLDALEDMFNFKIGRNSEREDYYGRDYVLTYEDKDGDWMMVGDVPWNMFTCCCKRMRMMKGSDARGLSCL
uniref:Auxin-responsive protein n=2 Tax=Cucumis sativus TaxID=3659 RepID=A0A0A0KKT1_CUCSA